MPSSDPDRIGNLVAGTDCAPAITGGAGCGVRDPRGASFGAPFNSNGGGVYTSQFHPSFQDNVLTRGFGYVSVVG